MTYVWRGFPPPKFGWRYSRETMAKLHEEGRIWYPNSTTKRPRLKRYLDESKGRIADNLWTDIPPVNSQAQIPSSKPRRNQQSAKRQMTLNAGG